MQSVVWRFQEGLRLHLKQIPNWYTAPETCVFKASSREIHSFAYYRVNRHQEWENSTKDSAISKCTNKQERRRDEKLHIWHPYWSCAFWETWSHASSYLPTPWYRSAWEEITSPQGHHEGISELLYFFNGGKGGRTNVISLQLLGTYIRIHCSEESTYNPDWTWIWEVHSFIHSLTHSWGMYLSDYYAQRSITVP